MIQKEKTNKKKEASSIAAIATAMILAFAIIAASGASSAYSQTGNGSNKTLRIGYFPNINHVQAVIGLGNGDYQKVLGSNVKIETHIFNAGPAAIEALFAKQIDVAYVGPGPAINGYVKSEGQFLRIIAGGASGGAAFVVRNDSGINSPNDLANKKLSAPEIGNTQDVALRTYLIDNGFKTKENGGNVEVLNAQNSDILTLFLKKEIDGAWVPEPWAERLVKEGGGKILVDERDLWKPDGKFVTANIVVSTEYLKNNPDVVKKLLEAHVSETQWINDHKPEAIKAFNEQLQKLTGKTISEDILNASLSRLEFTYDPIKQSLTKAADNAVRLGYLKQKPALSGIYDLSLLEQVLQEKGLPPTSSEQQAGNSNGAGQTITADNATATNSTIIEPNADAG
jgi:NitT/TauT family transport system substrate-binding protein